MSQRVQTIMGYNFGVYRSNSCSTFVFIILNASPISSPIVFTFSFISVSLAINKLDPTLSTSDEFESHIFLRSYLKTNLKSFNDHLFFFIQVSNSPKSSKLKPFLKNGCGTKQKLLMSKSF